MLDIKRVVASMPKAPEDVQLQTLFTPWGEAIARADEQDDPPHAADAAAPLPELVCHPRPQFMREGCLALDGWWSYAIVDAPDAACAWREAAAPDAWDGLIRVPFSPEAPLSGANRQLKPHELLWYRRTFATPAGLFARQAPARDARCILHFEAVDYACACWLNGTRIGTHTGGYTPFSFDITDALSPSENELALCVYDPSDEGVQPRGKQKLARGGIWYTAQSGIWQSVWIELVPACHIASLDIDADCTRIDVCAHIAGASEPRGAAGEPTPPLTVRLFDEGALVGEATCEPAQAGAGAGDSADAGEPSDVRHVTFTPDAPRLWSPDDAHLYDLELTLGDDVVKSYCAMRTVDVAPDEAGRARLRLNGAPYFLCGALDQGYWPDGLMSAPTDEALVFDIQTAKRLGFNMLRKHIKVESERWYYHCDRLGMLVWQDMVSGGAPYSSWHTSYKPTLFSASWSRYADDTPRHQANLSASSETFRTEWSDTCTATVARLKNHPCIITWVLFNEGWGQFDARTAVEAVRALDPSRPIDATSGWYDQGCGDFLSEHNYFRPLKVHRDHARPPRAFVISEFGGLSYHMPEHSSLATSYGYATYDSPSALAADVRGLLDAASALEARGLSGFVYTQLSDIEEETNGLVTYDRRVTKLDGDETHDQPR